MCVSFCFISIVPCYDNYIDIIQVGRSVVPFRRSSMPLPPTALLLAISFSFVPACHMTCHADFRSTSRILHEHNMAQCTRANALCESNNNICTWSLAHDFAMLLDYFKPSVRQFEAAAGRSRSVRYFVYI
uniref:Uncharacterized protein n=1 Tax=Octactis speculum TaxID=3111310 RepID=A0A7S2HA59_9STRA